MGWFTRLLNVFRKPKLESRLEKHTVHLNDFAEWLDVQKHHLLEKNKVNSEILQYTNQMKAKRWELECNVDEWQEKIPLGKRDDLNHFFADTRKLLDLITFSDDLELEGVLAIHKEVEQFLNQLIEEIEQDSFVSDFSFLAVEGDKTNNEGRNNEGRNNEHKGSYGSADDGEKESAEDRKRSGSLQVNPLLKELLIIRTSNDQFGDRIASAGVTTLENLEKKRGQIEEMQETLQKLMNKQRLMQERLQTAQAMKEEKVADLSRITEDPLYQEVGVLESQRFRLRQQRENLENEIMGFFSKLKPVFKKYLEINPNNLVTSYVEDSSLAFSLDENVNILHVFEHLQASLLQGKMNFETEKLNAYLDLVKKARSGYLEGLHKKYLVLHQELEGPSIPLKNRDYVMKLEEGKYRLDHFSKQFAEMEERKGALDEEVENFQEKYNREITLLQEMIKMGLGKEVMIRTSVVGKNTLSS